MDTPLPVEKMPECWFKDERMNSLFAEFRNKSVNPQDWESKYRFWKDFIYSWLKHNGQCVFTLMDLNCSFKRNGRTPLCLSTVVEQLYKNGEIITEMEFLSGQTTWTSWAVNTMIKKPLVWSLTKVKSYFNPISNDPNIKYVYIESIRDLGNLILSLCKDGEELILSMKQITEKCREKSGNNNINEFSIKMGLLWILKLKKTTLNIDLNDDNINDCLIKLSSNGVTNLNDSESCVYKLKERENLLLKQIENFEVERNNILMKAKLSVKQGLKEVAKTHLRKKNELDKRIEKHSAILLNIQTLISNIHDAHSNNDILSAYKKGSDILKNFEKTGLSEFNVRDTMDNMIDAVEDLNEVKNALSEPLKLNDSDLDLEEELNDLLNVNTIISPPPTSDPEYKELEKELEELCLKDLPVPPNSSFSEKEKTNINLI